MMHGLLHLLIVSMNVYMGGLRCIDVDANARVADGVAFHHHVCRVAAHFDPPVVLDDVALQDDQVIYGPLESCTVADLAILRAMGIRLARLRVLVRCKDTNRVPARQ